ncbi:MAG TPA: NPCBM/NEW2 domain-containing protein [Verrucomicrobiae bacterium]|nr:NPCBM/NEW2 domain-containing protein [Verrucomicrobiae bacterium]
MKYTLNAIAEIVLIPLLVLTFVASARAAETFWISSLDLRAVEQDFAVARKDASVDGRPLSIGGQKFEHGVGTHANSSMCIALNGQGDHFTAEVGVDDEVGRQGGVIFAVGGDGKLLWQSNVQQGGDPAKQVAVHLSGIKLLTLIVSAAKNDISFDHADWANAQIVMREGQPVAIVPPPESKVPLTPKPPTEPRINGARIFGVRPGSPFLFTIPTTGDRPMTFTPDHLPAGLNLDSQNGRITGTLTTPGEITVILYAQNAHGTNERKFKIVCGNKIALTPPMGWNSWNCGGTTVSDAKIRAAADAIVSSGLINHGWTYINIDDGWEGKRDANGKILGNEKFPDMKALADYVHSKGLKIGVYSSPGAKTCGLFEASYQHEQIDADRYAEWGFDYLKYDWCTYGDLVPHPSRQEAMKPFQVMHAALEKEARDIVFSISQVGLPDIWTWGQQVGGNCWRTGYDISDTWTSMSLNGFSQSSLGRYAGPGHWNDPDMLVVGDVGWNVNVQPTRLTPNERYTHISLWCLLSAPLLIGCDLTKLDDFTLGLLSNDEVLEVDQDPLGYQAECVARSGATEVWAKHLEDGSQAVGLFNRAQTETTLTAQWSDLGISGKQLVRDLWRQKDLGIFTNEFQTSVLRHGVVLVKISPK